MADDTAEVRRRLTALLGLARRAGSLALGITAVEQLVHRQRRPLVILASDAGAALNRRADRLAPVRGLARGPLDRNELAAACGRIDLAVVGVADSGFVRGLLQLGIVDPDAEEPRDRASRGTPPRGSGSSRKGSGRRSSSSKKPPKR